MGADASYQPQTTIAGYLRLSADAILATASAVGEDAVSRAIALCVGALRSGRSLLVCGNGGSASDAMHIAGELVGRFLKERRALKCVCLSDNPATLTALGNDYGYEAVFSRQVEAFGEKGGAIICISTSGNSPNVINAASKAREMGLAVVSMTGEGGGKLAALSDVLLAIPSRHTPIIQQAHSCLYHYMCEAIEREAAKP